MKRASEDSETSTVSDSDQYREGDRQRPASFERAGDKILQNDKPINLTEEAHCRDIEHFYHANITKGTIRAHDDDCCGFLSLPKSIDKTTQKPFAELHCEKNETNNVYGWKFHIILNQNIAGNIENGWNSILRILIANNIGKTKIILPNVKALDDKVVTIYACIEKNERTMLMWQKIINLIVQALVDNKVVPGHLPDEYRISGCSFVTYRNDLSRDGGYSQTNNESNQPDPYSGMVVNVSGQMELIAVSGRLAERHNSYANILQRVHESPRIRMDEEEKSESSQEHVVTPEEINRQFEETQSIIDKNIDETRDNDSDDDSENSSGCCC